MTDEDSNSPPTPELPERSSRNDTVDWVLENLVVEANERKSTFVDITLNVHGLIVSGTLVGISEYYRSAQHVFHKGKEPPEEGTWGAYFNDLANEIEKESEDQEPQSVSYIHLKNARIFSNGQRPLPTNQGIWWRGKLADVDAFWFGKLKSGDEEE